MPLFMLLSLKCMGKVSSRSFVKAHRICFSPKGHGQLGYRVVDMTDMKANWRLGIHKVAFEANE